MSNGGRNTRASYSSEGRVQKSVVLKLWRLYNNSRLVSMAYHETVWMLSHRMRVVKRQFSVEWGTGQVARVKMQGYLCVSGE
jgi:hypothetical protein